MDKWVEEKEACEKAFAKWVQQCEGLISEPCITPPEWFSAILSVIKSKDRWRWLCQHLPYKARCCLDLKSSGYNDSLSDWPFRYCTLDTIAECILKGDWLASLDISRFYLRLPAGRRLRASQWFQDPASYASSTHNNDEKSLRKLTFRQLLAVAFGLKSVSTCVFFKTYVSFYQDMSFFSRHLCIF